MDQVISYKADCKRLCNGHLHDLFIHVDIRRSEKAKQLTPTFFVHSTGKQFLQVLNAALRAAPRKPNGTAAWLERMKELQEQYFPWKHQNSRRNT